VRGEAPAAPVGYEGLRKWGFNSSNDNITGPFATGNGVAQVRDDRGRGRGGGEIDARLPLPRASTSQDHLPTNLAAIWLGLRGACWPRSCSAPNAQRRAGVLPPGHRLLSRPCLADHPLVQSSDCAFDRSSHVACTLRTRGLHRVPMLPRRQCLHALHPVQQWLTSLLGPMPEPSLDRIPRMHSSSWMHSTAGCSQAALLLTGPLHTCRSLSMPLHAAIAARAVWWVHQQQQQIDVLPRWYL